MIAYNIDDFQQLFDIRLAHYYVCTGRTRNPSLISRTPFTIIRDANARQSALSDMSHRHLDQVQRLENQISHAVRRANSLPYDDDSTFRDVASLLNDLWDCASESRQKIWAANPRLYKILKRINHTADNDVFTSIFEREHVADFSLPLSIRVLQELAEITTSFNYKDFDAAQRYTMSSPADRKSVV